MRRGSYLSITEEGSGGPSETEIEEGGVRVRVCERTPVTRAGTSGVRKL